jgi:hypothetical protein
MKSDMKKIIFILSLCLSSHLLASISIVSDLDDTIKITNSGDTVEGAINAALKSDVFTGMTEFFMAAKLYTNELHVLSASPTILRTKITMTLNKRNIDFDSLILKDPLKNETKFDYKVREIKKILQQSSDDLILIGDDVGQDPESYAEIQRLYPNRILAIYIHSIKNRQIPSGHKYWTTFDLFLREFTAERMSPGWLEKGIEILLQERELTKIVPLFAHCPTEVSIWTWQLSSIYSEEAAKMMSKITTYCKVRNSSILPLH